jgi:hypothetical protein
MIKTVSLTTGVPPDHELRIVLPEEIPPGPAEIVVVVASHAAAGESHLGDLANSDFFGMWRDREDIGDSAEFARRLREQAWNRAK